MRDCIDVGPAPPDEDCALVGKPDYFERARPECRAYVALLRRALGEEPPRARLFVQSRLHDFGTYLTVACHFDDSDEAAVDYAFRCEGKGPKNWDEQARRDLGLDQSEAGRKEMSS